MRSVGFGHQPISEANALMRMHQARLAQHIKRLRQARGLSTAGLARRLGYASGTWIVMIETGSRPLTLHTFRLIADGLDVTPGQLWRGEPRYERLVIDPKRERAQPLWPKKETR